MKGAAYLLKQPLVAASCVGLVVARWRCEEPVAWLRPLRRQAGSSHTGFCVHRHQPDGLRLPGDPLFSSPGRAGPSTTRGRGPQAWHGLAGCPEASRLLFLPFASIPLPPVPFLLSCNRRPPREQKSDLWTGAAPAAGRLDQPAHSFAIGSYVDGDCAIFASATACGLTLSTTSLRGRCESSANSL